MQTDLLPLAGDDGTEPLSRTIDVNVVRSARRRSLALHVDRLGRVELRAPLHAPARDIHLFLERHRAWVLRKLADARANPPWVPHWGEGGHWYWAGERVVLAGDGPRGGQLADGALRLPLAAGQAAETWQRAVFAWHRRQAAALLDGRARALFAQHCDGHRLREVNLRWMRATWGTCSARRSDGGPRDVKLRLNPWLAALPPSLADAIILHELAHVDHMNHGPRFYRRLAQLNPDFRAHDEALRDWARLLFPIAAR